MEHARFHSTSASGVWDAARSRGRGQRPQVSGPWRAGGRSGPRPPRGRARSDRRPGARTRSTRGPDRGRRVGRLERGLEDGGVERHLEEVVGEDREHGAARGERNASRRPGARSTPPSSSITALDPLVEGLVDRIGGRRGAGRRLVGVERQVLLVELVRRVAVLASHSEPPVGQTRPGRPSRRSGLRGRRWA